MIAEKFHGQLMSTLRCMSCGHTAASCDAIQTVALPIPSVSGGGSGVGDGGVTPATLGDCLRLFSAPEEVRGDDAWNCPKCKEYQAATKQVAMCRVPTVLVVQLKRFRFSKEGLRTKIEDEIRIPALLDVAPFLAGKSSWYRVI